MLRRESDREFYGVIRVVPRPSLISPLLLTCARSERRRGSATQSRCRGAHPHKWPWRSPRIPRAPPRHSEAQEPPCKVRSESHGRLCVLTLEKVAGVRPYGEERSDEALRISYLNHPVRPFRSMSPRSSTPPVNAPSQLVASLLACTHLTMSTTSSSLSTPWSVASNPLIVTTLSSFPLCTWSVTTQRTFWLIPLATTEWSRPFTSSTTSPA